MYSENNYMMWLNSLIQIGLKQRSKLIEIFGSAEAIWNAPSKEIRTAAGMNHSSMYNLTVTQHDDAYMEKLLRETEKANARFICRSDSEFPDILKEIYDCPLGLYIIGTFPQQKHKIAVVGSRNCTEYGASAAYNISRQLAENDIVIISGMADGIDSYAHKGALDAGARTIAIMGTGIDLCYPTANRALRDRIAESGCIISEYPPGMRGTAFTFPQRNRIISGLAEGVIVAEAAKRSGSLITAAMALEQGRDVFAVPGNITSKMSTGCNELIKNGAVPLLSANDILEYYNIEKPKKVKPEAVQNTLLTSEEQSVFKHLSTDPMSVEEIAQKTGMETKDLQGILTMLEINGHITKLSGQRYIRA